MRRLFLRRSNGRLLSQIVLGLTAVAFWAAGAAAEPTEHVTFATGVAAVLSKAGCNLGTCHGNFQGKGGFRLSLRGEDPTFDYRSLVREQFGRRVNTLDPAASLLLQKPTGRLAHQGGVRFREDSVEFTILQRWIEQGASGPSDAIRSLVELHVEPRFQVAMDPVDHVDLKVIAEFDDGHRQDVSNLAVYEPTSLSVRVEHDGRVERLAFGESTILVRYLNRQVPVQLAFIPSRTEPTFNAELAETFVDVEILARLKELRIAPAAKADAPTLVRRVYLDVLGKLPSAEEAREFVASAEPDIWDRIVDKVLATPEFAGQWALRWCDVLRNEDKVLDKRGVERFHGWLRDNFAANVPLDSIVRQLIVASGSTYENPPANYYRALRDPESRAETTARLFLGVRLQCAKCHNHPFDRWTQDDYFSWAAIFTRVDYTIVENQRRDRLDKHEFVGEQIVRTGDAGREILNPRNGTLARPKLLGDFELGPGAYYDRLAPVSHWLTNSDNRRFAEAQANFIWYHIMGKGLVEPIDDFRTTNPASHPKLLEKLADQLVSEQFNLRLVVRTILLSQAYSLASLPFGFGDSVSLADTAEDRTFSHAYAKRLPAEKLLDSQCQALDVAAEFVGQSAGIRAGDLPGVPQLRRRENAQQEGDRFLRQFGKPARLLACECERSNETTLSQAFVLISGMGLDRRLNDPGNMLEPLSKSGLTSPEIVTELYWRILSREPTLDEQEAAQSVMTSGADLVDGMRDVAWALLTSKEALFRH